MEERTKDRIVCVLTVVLIVIMFICLLKLVYISGEMNGKLDCLEILLKEKVTETHICSPYSFLFPPAPGPGPNPY